MSHNFCPEKNGASLFSRHNALPCNKKNQAGFLIPLALFILVGLGGLAVAINQMSSQSNTAYTLEGVSMQAFYAAETGAQFAMNYLMFDVSGRGGVDGSDANCASMPATLENFPSTSAAGLQACSIDIECQLRTVPGSPTSYYTITSTATCGGGNLMSERTIEVSAFL